MRGAVKMRVLIGGFLVAALIVVGVGESRRRAKLSEEPQPGGQASSSMPTNAGGAAKPPTETSVNLLPSMVGRVGEPYKGPASIELKLYAQWRIAFGLVSLDETDNYGKSNQIESAMNRLPCGSGGSEEISVSCEIPAGKTYILMVADVREPLRSADGGYVAVRRPKKGDTSEGTQYNNEVKISTTYTVLPTPNGK
jgi:hypothetical protein